MKTFNHEPRICPGCGNHLTSDRDSCALSSCTPPGVNLEASGGPLADGDRGVCTVNLTIQYPDLVQPALFVGLLWHEVELLVQSVAKRCPQAVFGFVVVPA